MREKTCEEMLEHYKDLLSYIPKEEIKKAYKHMRIENGFAMLKENDERYKKMAEKNDN